MKEKDPSVGNRTMSVMLRVSPEDRTLITEAAKLSDRKMADFARYAALKEARRVVAAAKARGKA